MFYVIIACDLSIKPCSAFDVNQGITVQTLILCQGLQPSQALFEMLWGWAEFVIAADGGMQMAQNFGQLPHVVVGDMDSVGPQALGGVRVVEIADQDTHDLEKALDYAKQQGAQQIKILGALGKRLDHTLQNVACLKRFKGCFQCLEIQDDHGMAFLLPKTYVGHHTIGTKISLLPLSGRVASIKTHGLKYALKYEPLEVGINNGLSNEVIESPYSIEHEQGDLLLFVVH